MNITSPLLNATAVADLPGESVSSLLRMISHATGLFGDSEDGGLGLVMSALAGVATALAVAITLLVYFGHAERSWRDVVKHGVAATVVVALFAFVVYDMRRAALTFLGINPSRPAIEFEIRLPREALTSIADTQVELRTNRNQQLADVQGSRESGDGRSVLRGIVTLDYRTSDRIVVLNLPSHASYEFRLRLPPSPAHSDQYGPWHLADHADSSSQDIPASQAHDAFAIRYRVL
jgi:hypothetical protein